MLGVGIPRMGTLGLAPPYPGCKWEPLQPSPMAMGTIKAKTRGEAAGRKGVSKSSPSPNGEIQTETRVEEERGDG